MINALTPPGDKLEGVCDTLNLTNLIKLETCYTNDHKSVIYFSRANSIFSRKLCHRIWIQRLQVSSFMRSFVSHLKPKKKNFFRNCKKFNETKLLNNLKKKLKLSFTPSNPNETYLYLRNSFSRIVKKHAVEKLGRGRGGRRWCQVRSQPTSRKRLAHFKGT